MRTIEEIRMQFEYFKSDTRLNNLQKNMRYVRLMDELEQEHSAMVLNPSKIDCERSEVDLYSEISKARKIR